MKIDDIWKNGEQPDIKNVDPKDDKKRTSWYHELEMINDKAIATYRKLVDAGKVLEWDADRADVIQIRIFQGPNFRIVDDAEGQKFAKWFNELDERRLQISQYLLKDMDTRGSPLDYKKKPKKK